MEPLPIHHGARSDIGAAAKEAVEAAHNSEQLALIQAVLAAQQLAQHPQPVTQPVQQSSGGAGKWIGIGVGASVFLLTVALSAVAVAIAVVSLTVCVLVLRSVWHDIRKSH
ncbi:hypothetical protein [Streptomyces sp. NBC_00859]|uniref:hypothetical protein n=1 Tax=Streptomyces sp. NBC_00859 TaxID=2903682 RepID=UPI002F915426|nr:hypothetical protein OG584_17650 [Streptomyces sp. NBC_00859]WSZ87258.1 hypothetical protein OG584_35180 [Streptomyces sp. NBC_00859]